MPAEIDKRSVIKVGSGVFCDPRPLLRNGAVNIYATMTALVFYSVRVRRKLSRTVGAKVQFCMESCEERT
jgi:hypothetical protein